MGASSPYVTPAYAGVTERLEAMTPKQENPNPPDQPKHPNIDFENLIAQNLTHKRWSDSMSPKDRAIQNAMAAIEKALSDTLKTTLPKVMGELFDAGGIEYATALQKAMQSVGSTNHPGRSIIGGAGLLANSTKTAGVPGKDGRAPRGSVRRAVLSTLLPNPAGLTAADIVSRAQQIDPSISAGGIHNELNRQKGMLYLNEGGIWRTPPDLKLGGNYYDLNSLRVAEEKPRAVDEVSE